MQLPPHIPREESYIRRLSEKIADIAEKYGAAALKITSAQRIAIVGLKEEDLDSAWGELGLKPGSCNRALCQERQNLPRNYILQEG